MGQEAFEGLSPFEIKLKMIILVQSATTLILKGTKESKRDLEFMKNQYDQELKKKGKEFALKLKELTTKDATRKEELERAMEERDELKKQMNDIENKTNKSTNMFVLEARLKMVEDVQDNKIDSWAKQDQVGVAIKKLER
ncbi:unnamed protein product [Lactuca virosa]|uniref:Uncharacterized protein n=1 Tax=Lactuca virosa TaxID=75947 RepID=A0AAU9N105_9ASTR|nr:unnamed protein product [Lactuca virosa]